MRILLTMVMMVAAGCDDDSGSMDMALDLSMPVPDLASGVDVDSGMCAPAGMTHAKQVLNTLTVPQARSDFSMDLNGDGRNDNQLGNIIGALAGAGLDTQATADAQIAAGNDVMLIDLASADPTFVDDVCAGATFYQGANQASPNFDAGASFTIDGTVAPTIFTGPIAATRFSSVPLPQAQSVPEKLTIRLPLFGLVPVTLWGAHLQFKYAGGGLVSGQINGAMTSDDVQKQVVPSMAALFTQKIQSDPSSSTSMQLKQLFDTGNGSGGACMNPDGSSSPANDSVIGACEVSGNAIIKNVLAPDVQMFQNGVYKPSASNTMKDSVSVGLGFTAVAASF